MLLDGDPLINRTMSTMNIDYAKATLSLDDILTYFHTMLHNSTRILEWRVRNGKITRGYSKPPMYTSYQDWSRLCFTRKSEYSQGLIKSSEGLFLNLTNCIWDFHNLLFKANISLLGKLSLLLYFGVWIFVNTRRLAQHSITRYLARIWNQIY